MDAAWKVYVGDRRFDDDQISNCFLKMKYETVGRFTFDFRAMDGDESYMVVGNTLRIFWGDLHKMDGVIQRADWDSKQFCYHVYGADIRGFLLDRVNTEPATVSSYTSDVTSQVMFTGCDFPTNIWTGAGESIGKYTFHYKIGIQNTIRITGATQNVWRTCFERGTVYDHVNGCLYDATKNWTANAFAGATLRFVSGACKNNVYNINGNTNNRVCIRLPGETAAQYTVDTERQIEVGTLWYTNYLVNATFSRDDDWEFWNSGRGDGYISGGDVYLDTGSLFGYYYHTSAASQVLDASIVLPASIVYRYKHRRGPLNPNESYGRFYFETPDETYYYMIGEWGTGTESFFTNPSWPDYDIATHAVRETPPYDTIGPISEGATFGIIGMTYSYGQYEVWIDRVWVYSYEAGSTAPAVAVGTIPACSRIGDIYEIVFASMERIDPQLLPPATLEKDNHIIRYNRVNSLSDHVTSMTIRGT